MAKKKLKAKEPAGLRQKNYPTVERLFDITKILNVDVKTLLNSNND